MGEVGDYWREAREARKHPRPGKYRCECGVHEWRRKPACGWCKAENPYYTPKPKAGERSSAEEGVMTDKRCGTCRHWNVKPDRDGKVRIRRDRAYPCSMERAYTAPPVPPFVNLHVRRGQHLFDDSGADCPLWEKR